MDLPTFKYHPDPLATGSVAESDTECVCCGQVRGYIYTGPVYAIEEYYNCICPWCIADGSAYEKLDAMFTDDAGIGGYGEWDEVAEEVIEAVTQRNSWVVPARRNSPLSVPRQLQPFRSQQVSLTAASGMSFSPP